MSQIKTTKEERLLLAIAKASKSNPSQSINAAAIAQALGFSEKQSRKAINLLARGNCIVKRGEWDVEITPHGFRTVDHIN